MSEYESSSLIVIDQMQPLADSRVIARELDIDHESFSAMVKRYQQEIEADCGRIRFEIGVKAGPQRGKLPPPKIKSLWERRRELFRFGTKIPEGYWCIFEMIASYCRTEEYRGVHLSPEALPDVSIGLMWCQYLRALGYDPHQVKKYPHVYPDRRGVQLANIYPNDWLGAFWTWFHGCYFKEHYPAYLRGRTIPMTTTTTVAQLPHHTSRKEGEGKQREQHA